MHQGGQFEQGLNVHLYLNLQAQSYGTLTFTPFIFQEFLHTSTLKLPQLRFSSHNVINTVCGTCPLCVSTSCLTSHEYISDGLSTSTRSPVTEGHLKYNPFPPPLTGDGLLSSALIHDYG